MDCPHHVGPVTRPALVQADIVLIIDAIDQPVVGEIPHQDRIGALQRVHGCYRCVPHRDIGARDLLDSRRELRTDLRIVITRRHDHQAIRRSSARDRHFRAKRLQFRHWWYFRSEHTSTNRH